MLATTHSDLMRLILFHLNSMTQDLKIWQLSKLFSSVLFSSFIFKPEGKSTFQYSYIHICYILHITGRYYIAHTQMFCLSFLGQVCLLICLFVGAEGSQLAFRGHSQKYLKDLSCMVLAGVSWLGGDSSVLESKYVTLCKMTRITPMVFGGLLGDTQRFQGRSFGVRAQTHFRHMLHIP